MLLFLASTNDHLKNNFIQYNLIVNINYRIDDKCNIVCFSFNLVLSLLNTVVLFTVIIVMPSQLIFY